MRTADLVQTYEKMQTSLPKDGVPTAPDGLTPLLATLEAAVTEMKFSALPGINVSDDGTLHLFIDQGQVSLEMDVASLHQAKCYLMLFDPTDKKYIHFGLRISAFSPLVVDILVRKILPHISIKRRGAHSKQSCSSRSNPRLREVRAQLRDAYEAAAVGYEDPFDVLPADAISSEMAYA